MIWNIIDLRTRPFRWKRVNAIIESTAHDNSRLNADRASPVPARLEIIHERQDGISVRDAVLWADQSRYPVTLYLYDPDDNTTEMHSQSTLGRFPEEEQSG